MVLFKPPVLGTTCTLCCGRSERMWIQTANGAIWLFLGGSCYLLYYFTRRRGVKSTVVEETGRS